MKIDKKMLSRVEQEMDNYHGRFERYFARSEPREQSRKYLHGLLSAQDRRNGWELSETVGDSVPDRTQRLLYRSGWDLDGVLDEHIRFAAEHVGMPHGTFVIDETGFLKSGKCSAGVQRQYTGTAGKITNCQIGVFLGYASGQGSMLLDRRLYMPKIWCDNADKRNKVHVPQDLTFATKPQQALAMLKHAVGDLRFPGRWVVGDEVYGGSDFRAEVAKLGLYYVLAVSCTDTAKNISEQTSGRPPLSFWAEETSMAVNQIARNIPNRCWHSLVTKAGEKAPIRYLWAAIRVMISKTEEGWLLIRRSLSDRDDMAFYFSNAPAKTSVKTLAKIALQRAEIEKCFSEAKTEAGMDEYEVRLWPAWYRHITLAIMAHAFLTATKKTFDHAILRQCLPHARCSSPGSATPRRHRKREFLFGLGRVQSSKTPIGSSKSLS
ncbi:MAG: IS701 family transposase [Candidatus Riflebacteria bacterium]|nr:IS701 family transposase [Candidatus Riflebacteria bacterium]